MKIKISVFPNGFEVQARGSVGWLHHYGLASAEIVTHNAQTDKWPGFAVAVDPAEVPAFLTLAKANPARFGKARTLWDLVLWSGLPHAHHETDLYIPDNEQARQLLAFFPLENGNAKRFKNQVEGGTWIDVPFSYIPEWDRKLAKRKLTSPGAYSNTPHKTIEELVAMAEQRTASGEDCFFVRQDIVNGYNLGFQSANDALIDAACQSGAAKRA